MRREKAVKLNIVVTLIHQLVTLLCGLILPKFILLEYGSEANGLMQFVSQILNYTALLELGAGGAVTAFLYKPLAKGDMEAVSDIFNYTRRFFKRISVVFFIFSIVFAFTAKLFIQTTFSFEYVAAIVLILAMNMYFVSYFGVAHQLLMKADQRLYAVQSVQIVTLILNLVLCIGAIELGANVHTVKFITAFVFLANPIFFRLYVRKKYNINKQIFNKEREMPATKYAMVHYLAYFVHRNTDVVIISTFTNVINASIYSVYHMVILAIEQLLSAISTAVAGAVGNIIAKGQKKTLESSFDLYEAVNTFLATWAFTLSAILILPFVRIYTQGVNDAEYINPLFAYLSIGAGFVYCIRIPYWTVISSAGHYKETRLGALIEVLLNISLSLLLIKPMGIAGVAVGTLAAMSFRTVHVALYLKKSLLQRPFWRFLKSFGINLITATGIVLLFERFFKIDAEGFFSLALWAAGAGIIVGIILAGVNLLINIKTFGKRAVE